MNGCSNGLLTCSLFIMANMMSSTEFLKIKEKQKAFGMNNGLRVHEVSSCFEFSHFREERCFFFTNSENLNRKGHGNEISQIGDPR